MAACAPLFSKLFAGGFALGAFNFVLRAFFFASCAFLVVLFFGCFANLLAPVFRFDPGAWVVDWP